MRLCKSGWGDLTKRGYGLLSNKDVIKTKDMAENRPQQNLEVSPQKRARQSRGKKIESLTLNLIKGLGALAVSAFLVIWLFKKVDFAHVEAIVREGVDYRYIVAMMFLTVLSHVIRGVRWGIQLRAVGIPRISPVAESVSIFGAYALNLVFPFLGEAWRCVYISRRENTKLSTVVGTDIGDRTSDGLMIGMFILLTLWVAHPAMERFFSHYALGNVIDDLLFQRYSWLIVGGTVALLLLLDRLFRHTKVVQGINNSCRRIWEGFVVLFHLDQTWLYIIYTIGIWLCYFLETYLMLYAFPFTRELITTPGTCWGLVPGLVVFVFGSCSMIVPSNGGLGPWNIAVMFALTLYGISDAQGTAFSLVYWSFQSLTLVAAGIFSAIYIAVTKKKMHKKMAGETAK